MIKPILKYTAMLICILYSSTIYIIVAILYFIFTFKILRYGMLNNNAGYINPKFIYGVNTDEPYKIQKGHSLYYEEKNPYDSWKRLCNFLNNE